MNDSIQGENILSSTPLAPALGAIVYYVLTDDFINKGQVRPAMVVRVWSATTLNLRVFLDGANDKFVGPDGWQTAPDGTLWKTSVLLNHDKVGGTWNWGEAILEPYEA